MPPAYEVLLLNTAVPQIQAAQAGDTYVCPRDIQITANLDVTGNTILGNASTDTVRVNGYMGVGGAPGASTAITVAPTALTGTLQYGVSSQPTGTSAATNSIIAFDAFAQVANAVFTVNNVYGLSVRAGSKGASATATNWHGIQIADQTQGTNNYGITSLVSSGTDKWNIYASGTAANYFAGVTTFATAAALTNVSGSITPQVQIRGSTANTGSFLITRNSNDSNGPSFWLGKDRGGGAAVNNDILGLIRIAGNDGTSYVEAARIVAEVDGTPGTNDMPGRLVFSTTADGASSPTERARIDSTGASIFKPAAGTGAVFNEDGVDADFRVESDTNTHALFVEGSSGNVGMGTSTPTVKFEVNAGLENIVAKFVSTDAGSWIQFNDNDALGYYLGAVTSSFVIRDTNNTERLRIDSSGNVKIGGTADRATTVGTNHLDIFNGTAPVGTITNGISIYSSAGEAYVMDAAGNATLFSPHDAETNEWIFKSKHTPTGKVLKIDVERLLKFVNDHFGLDAVHEFIED